MKNVSNWAVKTSFYPKDVPEGYKCLGLNKIFLERRLYKDNESVNETHHYALNRFFSLESADQRNVRLRHLDKLKNPCSILKCDKIDKFSITTETWVISKCKKGPKAIHHASTYQLVIEGIHDGMQIALCAFIEKKTTDIVPTLVDLHKNRNLVENLINNFSITQLNVTSEQAKILIQNLHQDDHMLKHDDYMMKNYELNWLTYALNTIGISINGGNVMRYTQDKALALPVWHYRAYDRAHNLSVITSRIGSKRLLTEDSFSISIFTHISFGKYKNLIYIKEELIGGEYKVIAYKLSSVKSTPIDINILDDLIRNCKLLTEWSISRSCWTYEYEILNWDTDPPAIGDENLRIDNFIKWLKMTTDLLWGNDHRLEEISVLETATVTSDFNM